MTGKIAVPSPEDLLALMIGRGMYTERDGGDWYVVTCVGDRLAEGFVLRDDARRFVFWFATGDKPRGWRIVKVGRGDEFRDIIIPRKPSATLWMRAAWRQWEAVRGIPIYLN